ncbi:MAG: prepilin-type N-terminal cleavage/methylation domain-containing protein [Candidatus Omnitrophica bacterium]|nr:prepilin-type N-terminal cleavage/methylation domain-containing protein [Candidatus Omnitrophota bacterium]
MRKKGYTFAEILFVIIILGVLAGIAIPRVGVDFAVKMKVKTAAQRLASDLRLTRRLAVTNNENYKLSVDSSAKKYSIYNSADEQTGITRSIDTDIIVSADKDFIFEALGNASVSSDTVISLLADENQADITVTAATGKISVSGL